MTRRLLLLVVSVMTLVSTWCGPASAAQAHPAVVVVGIPGLQWDQVSATGTPTLWRLSRTGSVGALSVRSAADTTCPADGWLTIGAGNRVRADRGACTDTTPLSWPDISKDNRSLDFAAVPGILAAALASAGAGCVAAVGPGAALGATDRSGRSGPYAASVSAAALARCPVTLVGTPVVTSSASKADAAVAAVDAARPAGSVLLVVGLSDTDPKARAHLHVAMAIGGPYGPGELRSQSTRRAPYVQLIDVTATVLDLRGASGAAGVAAAVDGQPWRTSGHRPASLASLGDADKAAGAMRAALPWVVGLLVVLAAAGAALSFTARRRVASLVLLVALSGPVATYLINLTAWFKAPAPTITALLLTLVVAVLLAVPAFRVGEGRSWVIAAGAVMGLTFAVLVVDVLTGSRLQLDSILGYSPLVAGRFSGFGNVAYGVLGASALLLSTSLAIKRPGWRGVLAVGVVAVLADGAPMWGSDVGGVLALIPGFAIMLLLCTGSQVSRRRLVAIGAAAVAVVLAFALADYTRPASDQTHLGRFIGRILHGGAGTVLDRKLHSDLDLLTANAATLFVPVAIAVALWLILRPRPRLARTYRRHPELRFGLISLAVLSLVGLVVNDSGIAIPAVAVLLGVPYVLTVLIGDTSPEPPSDPEHVLP
jgi:hypothetical protein